MDLSRFAFESRAGPREFVAGFHGVGLRTAAENDNSAQWRSYGSDVIWISCQRREFELVQLECTRLHRTIDPAIGTIRSAPRGRVRSIRAKGPNPFRLLRPWSDNSERT
jgi:hypothetical protein